MSRYFLGRCEELKVRGVGRVLLPHRVVAAPRCCRTALLPHRVVVAPQEGARCEGMARPYQSTYDGVRCSQLDGGSRGGLLALGPRRGVGRGCSGAEAAAETNVGPGQAAPAPRRSVPAERQLNERRRRIASSAPPEPSSARIATMTPAPMVVPVSGRKPPAAPGASSPAGSVGVGVGSRLTPASQVG